MAAPKTIADQVSQTARLRSPLGSGRKRSEKLSREKGECCQLLNLVYRKCFLKNWNVHCVMCQITSDKYRDNY